MVKGNPYQPHSQGVVERVHITLRKALIVNYLENLNNFNIESALPLIVNIYNNTVHSVTKYTPNEILYSHDSLLHEKIYNNINDYYNKRQKHTISYDVGEKCLMKNYVLKTKKKINKIILLEKNKLKKNKSFYKIYVLIEKNLNGGIYLIKIIGNYKFLKLFNGELYCANFSLLMKCENSLWEDLKIFNSSLQPIILIMLKA